MISTQNLTVGYRGKIVVSGVELDIKPGQIVTLIGPNGGGKSTILKTIARQLEPLGGSVYLDGKDISALNINTFARNLAFLTTQRPKTELTTCFDIVSMGRYPYTGMLGILSDNDKAEVWRALELVGASELANRDFLELSDGQRQLVMLARAICQRPRVLLLDEPTSFLDLRRKLELIDILKRLINAEKPAILMSLHELDLAQKISDTVACVKDGRIDKIGSPEEVFTDGYMETLFGVTVGSYDSVFGSPIPQRAAGEPRVFVIGGGGDGIDTYRRLYREGVPFAAGVIFDSDVEIPIVRPLAAEVITAPAFEPIGDGAINRAVDVLKSCEKVIISCRFGTFNSRNRQLITAAEEHGIEVEHGV